MSYLNRAALLGLLLVVGVCTALQSPRQPHLVLIVADDLGWNDVSWHNGGVVSPHLGRLASEGVVLNRTYVQPVCSPTRSALLASRYPFTIGRQGEVIWPLVPTGLTLNASLLPQELKKLGYDTHAVGKWHLGFCKWDYTPTFRGFDSFFGYYTGSEDYYTHMRSYSYTTGFEEPALGYDFRNDTAVDAAVRGNYSAFLFSNRVDSLLRARNPEKPLFLYVPFQSVHSPLQVPENYSNIYKNISNHNRRTYLGMVSALDDAVDRIITSLKSTGHYNNSIIVFTTDNGGPTISGANNWPLRGNKTTLWEGGTRGSAFIHSPLLANPGTISNRLVHVTDWYPTFVHLAGGTAPGGIDGVNQWEALNNASLPDARDYFVYDINEANGMSAAIRWGRYKLIVGDPGPSSWTPPPNPQKAPVPIHGAAVGVAQRSHLSAGIAHADASSESAEASRDNGENKSSEEHLKEDGEEYLKEDSEEHLREDIENAIHPSRTFNSKSLNIGGKASNDLDFDFFFQNDKIHPQNSGGYRRETIEEDSNENSIFQNEQSNNLGNRFGKFPSKATKLDAHSKAFIDRGLNYFEDNHVDARRLLHRDRGDQAMALGDFVRDDTHENADDWLSQSANNQGDKSRRREMKRRYRLASGISARLSDFATVEDLIDSNVQMQLYDVEDDPAERLDLVKIRRPVVNLMLARLQQELSRYTPPDVPPDDNKGNPDNFGGVWSPGWC